MLQFGVLSFFFDYIKTKKLKQGSKLTCSQTIATVLYRPDGLASDFTAQLINHIADP